MIEATAGLALGALSILFARFTRTEHWFYSSALIALPLIYVAFAAYLGHGPAATLEMLWGIPFFAGGILLSIFKPSKAIALIGTFWLMHGGYDLTHEYLFSNPGVPGWYPIFCAAVDLVVGVYLLIRSRKAPQLTVRHA